MKCDFCGSDLNEDDTYCPSCGSIQLTIKILNARAKKIMLQSIVSGLVFIVGGVILFLIAMDLSHSLDLHRICSEGDAWDILFIINLPMFILTFCVVFGVTIMLVGAVVYDLYSRKEV